MLIGGHGIEASQVKCEASGESKKRVAADLKKVERALQAIADLDVYMHEEYAQRFVGALALTGFRLQRQLDRLNQE